MPWTTNVENSRSLPYWVNTVYGATQPDGQPFEPAPKPQLRPDAAVGSVVHIPGDDQEGRSAIQAQSDEVVEGFERCLPQGPGDRGRRLADAFERRVEMQVGGVNKAEVLVRATHESQDTTRVCQILG